MPDWFYRTLTQPVLFRLPAERSRGFALGFLGRLARLPLGPAAIDFLGHMRADPRLGRTVLGCRFPSVLGLGPELDPQARALPALVRFGFGFLEVGPVSLAGSRGGGPAERRVAEEALWSPDPPTLIAGLSAYGAALGIHLTVGYTSWMHLLPVFLGLGLLALALALSAESLCGGAGEERKPRSGANGP